MGLCHPFSLIFLESSDNSLSNRLTGSQQKTYQEMLGLTKTQKEKENQEHCSSLSARSALSVNTSLANLYKFQT